MRLHFIVWSCLLSLAVLGCGSQKRDFVGDGEGGAAGATDEGKGGEKELSGAGGDTGKGEGEGDAGSGAVEDERPAQLDCTESQLIDVGSELFTGTTTDGGDDIDASCFSGNGDDLAVEWIAPRSDYYRFTTAGSDYDTALALLDDSCDGKELACNADSSAPEVEIVAFVEKDERVVAVLDGKAGASGEVVLGIEAISCPGLDLSEEVLPIELSTQNQGDKSAACGGNGKSDRALRFTPPEDGLYRFSATSDEFEAIVSVEEGPACGGALLGCGYSSREGSPAQVVRELAGGEPVTVFVDGGSGKFELDVEAVSAPAACPSESATILLEGDLPSVSGNFVGATHLLSGSCAPTGDFDPVASYEPLVDRSYPLSINLPPDMSCQLNIVSSKAIAVYVLEGGACEGPELSCATSPPDQTGVVNFTSEDNGDYVLVVEDLDGFRAEFEITTSCII
jgi:hypothetical protein